ncbi:MAG: prepilin-type N-terminal cleavage/methylation domain-containing protein [Vulcanimicrobiota bacterium]
MSQRRGFTLVEILVVLCLMGLLIVPLGMLLDSGYQHFTALSRTADAKNDCSQARERIFTWLARHPKYRLDQDNHGLSAGGSRLRWHDQQLLLDGHSLLRWPVRDFSVIPGPSGLILNLSLDVQVDSRRPVLKIHEIYDAPARQP